jgi:hypothetical protein
MAAEWTTLASLPQSSLAQRYVSGVIQTSLQLTVTVRYDPVVVTFLKYNLVMSSEWSTLDSLPHSPLAQKYVSSVIQTSLEITVTLTRDPDLELYVLYVIHKQNWVISAESSTLDSLPHSTPAQRYLSG